VAAHSAAEADGREQPNRSHAVDPQDQTMMIMNTMTRTNKKRTRRCSVVAAHRS